MVWNLVQVCLTHNKLRLRCQTMYNRYIFEKLSTCFKDFTAFVFEDQTLYSIIFIKIYWFNGLFLLCYESFFHTYNSFISPKPCMILIRFVLLYAITLWQSIKSNLPTNYQPTHRPIVSYYASSTICFQCISATHIQT